MLDAFGASEESEANDEVHIVIENNRTRVIRFFIFAPYVAAGFKSINYWIVRRLRSIVWRQWKNYRTRVRELKKRGIPHLEAVLNGCSRKGPWRMSKVK
jgi:hypothetical protein